MARQNLNNQMKSALYKQFEEGKGRSRHQDKIDKKERGEGKHIRDKIYSGQSLKTHLDRQKTFINYIKEHPTYSQEVKNITDITPKVASDFLRHQEKHGGHMGNQASSKTVGASMAMLNRVCNHWDKPITKREAGVSAFKPENTRNNRTLSPQQRELRYDRLKDTNKDLVNFSRSFGARRGEMCKEAHSYSSPVRTNCLYEKDNRIWCALRGKGGKVRNAVCLKEQEQYIRDNYGEHIIQRDTHVTASEYKDMTRGQPLLFDYSCSKSLQIQQLGRQWYANQLLNEVEKEQYNVFSHLQEMKEANVIRFDESRANEKIEINGREISEGNGSWISINLGHNKIENCLDRYINI